MEGSVSSSRNLLREIQKRDNMMTKRDAIAVGRDGLPAHHSRHLAEPSRDSSQMVQHVIHWFKSAVYSALRPFAHRAKPMLWRLAQKPAARKWVIRVFGRHSRLMNTARLFLIGVPTSLPPDETSLSPEMLAEGESLSTRGREVLTTLVEMRKHTKGETRRASRT